MKTTIHSIVWDCHNGSHEVCLYTSDAARDAALKSYMEERLGELNDLELAPHERECSALIERGEVMEAWEIFTDSETEIKHPEDYIYVEAHEVTLT